MTTTTQDRPSLRTLLVAEMPSMRRALNSVQDFDTNILTLSPRFIEALHRVAPQRRSRRLGKAIAVALLVVVALFAADPSARSLVIDRGQRVVAIFSPKKALPAVAPGPVPALDATVVVPSSAVGPAATLEIPPVVVTSEMPAFAPAAKAPAKKAHAGKGRPSPRAGHGGRG